ncbi:hypothetical protein F5B19DRAFT_454933 [Rostrohypoxylon terebratum]|nr:hypothetical protein F5B19DRAFT_454933 [Rostrohypoxylon terebratum]
MQAMINDSLLSLSLSLFSPPSPSLSPLRPSPSLRPRQMQKAIYSISSIGRRSSRVIVNTFNTCRSDEIHTRFLDGLESGMKSSILADLHVFFFFLFFGGGGIWPDYFAVVRFQRISRRLPLRETTK